MSNFNLPIVKTINFFLTWVSLEETREIKTIGIEWVANKELKQKRAKNNKRDIPYIS